MLGTRCVLHEGSLNGTHFAGIKLQQQIYGTFGGFLNFPKKQTSAWTLLLVRVDVIHHGPCCVLVFLEFPYHLYGPFCLFFAAYFWRWPCRFKLSRSRAFWWTLFIRRQRQRSWATKVGKTSSSNHPFFSICKKTCEFQGGYISEEKIAGSHVSWIVDMFHGCIEKPRCLEKTVYAPSSHIFQPLQGGGFNDFLMFTPIWVLMIQFEFRIFFKWVETQPPN